MHNYLVLRNVSATAPDRLWLTDITEHPVANGGKLNFCAIMDVRSIRVVGYSSSVRMTSRLALDALTSAIAPRGYTVAGCTVHADRRSQVRSRRFLAALREHGLTGPMGQVTSVGDDAAME